MTLISVVPFISQDTLGTHNIKKGRLLNDEVSSAELTNYTADALLSVQCNVYTCITAAVLRAFHPPIAVCILLGIAL